MHRLCPLLSILFYLHSLSSFALTYDRLSFVLSEPNGPRSIESLLEWISKNAPEQLSNFTLMHESRSAQEGSFLNPRTIAFGNDAKLIISFNGSPSLKGYHQVELIHYKDSTKNKNSDSNFEFREIQFDPLGVNRPRISEPNPAKCMQCHYQPMRPIWEPYEIWPGAYGKFDDSLIDFKNEKYAPLGKPDALIRERQEEFDQYQLFRKLATNHPRYRWLPFAAATEEYANISPYSPSEKHSNYQRRPNLKFTELIAGLHAKNLATRLKAGKAIYPNLALLVEAQLLDCSSHLSSKEQIQKIESITNLLRAQMGDDRTIAPWNRSGYANAEFKLGILLSALGIESTDFNYSREPEYWTYFTGELYLHEYFSKELYEKLGEQNHDLPEFTHYTSYNRTEIYPGIPAPQGEPAKTLTDACESLVNRYFASNDPLKLSEGFLSPIPMCLSCHGNEGPGPKIPFENPEEILANSDWVRKIEARITSKDPRTRMPPNRFLGTKEQASIHEYLHSIEN